MRSTRDSAGRDGTGTDGDGTGRDGTGTDGTPQWGRLNPEEVQLVAPTQDQSAGQQIDPDAPNPAKAGSVAIQHYLDRPFRPYYPLLHGLFRPSRAGKDAILHYPGSRTERDGNGT